MSTENDPFSLRAAGFLTGLRGLQEDRGKMAALRRGLSDATQREAWPVLAALGQDFGQIAPRTVAALFAVHPVEDPTAYSFGASCRRIATDNGREPAIPESFERRFRRLLACDSAEDVAGQLAAWVRLAANRNVGLNYAELFKALSGWHYAADRTKLRWARDFWSPRRDEKDEAPAAEPMP